MRRINRGKKALNDSQSGAKTMLEDIWEYIYSHQPRLLRVNSDEWEIDLFQPSFFMRRWVVEAQVSLHPANKEVLLSSPRDTPNREHPHFCDNVNPPSTISRTHEAFSPSKWGRILPNKQLSPLDGGVRSGQVIEQAWGAVFLASSRSQGCVPSHSEC